MADANATVTSLLTLLNVSATKSNKRKLPHTLPVSSKRLNKRRATLQETTEIRQEVSKDNTLSEPKQIPAESEELVNGEDAVSSEDENDIATCK